MFGGAKPTFGSTSTGTGFGSFTNTSTASPFGQSAFGKPATFGAAPTFGTQQTTTSLFGATTGQTQQTSGLFGGTSSTFGSTTTTQPAFGGFSQPQQNTSIFGTTPQAANTSSLFGQTNTSAFGTAVKPGGLGGFGQATTQPTTSLFGQPTASTSGSGFSSFGQTAPTTSNVFGANATSAFGQTPAQLTMGTTGTSIAKYQPTIGTDTLMKAGQPNNVNTKQHCITAMKEYENKSLEELRMEDYLANRKGPQAGSSTSSGFFGAAGGAGPGSGLFGASAQQSSGLFGQPSTAPAENKSLFGNNAFGQATQSPFGATQQQSSFLSKPFGAPAGSAFSATTTDAANPFSTKTAFGQTPTLFGQQPASNPSTFGQASTGFSSFGTTVGQQPTLFGQTATSDANKTGFGLGGASNSGFGTFGAATNPQGSSLFNTKPGSAFGTAAPFGATSQANTGFSNFSLNNTTGTGGLFNSTLSKPSTGFGAFGVQTSTAPLNFNSGTGGASLFNNAATKPGGFFGNAVNTVATNNSGGIFGGANTFGTPNSLGGIFNSLGGAATLSGGINSTSLQTTIPIHQQILSKVTSPYGDNPIFKDLNRNDETDAMRATNPLAQKAILDSSNSGSQFRVSAKSSPGVIKVKPIGSTLSKKVLFEGLEEFDSSVESFTLKPNLKRLIINPKPQNTVLLGGNETEQRNNNNTSENNDEPGTRNLSESSPLPSKLSSEGAQSKTNMIAIVTTKDADNTRRESWLHPNNLEKVRQQNLNANTDSPGVLNNTLSELVPRKPLETYRAPTVSQPSSMSSVPENPFENGSNISYRKTNTTNANDSFIFNRSNVETDDEHSSKDPPLQTECDTHPTGITLRRVGYYTVPSLDDLNSYLAEDGSCVVPNFTIGREGYGNVYFGKEMNVAGLNLDKIVHFRNKEVVIYPDDKNKPEVGSGLNREAQVTLDQVWPYDKTKHEPIKDPKRLSEMNWEEKLRRVCDKNDTRFIEYRPETGSWVFRVKHFSKYGLNDSDEEDDIPTDAKKAKIISATVAGAEKKSCIASTKNKDAVASENEQRKIIDVAGSLESRNLTCHHMDDSAEFMLMDKTQFLTNEKGILSPTSVLAKGAGTDSHKLQLMKASFFAEDADNKSISSESECLYDYDQNVRSSSLRNLQNSVRSVRRNVETARIDNVLRVSNKAEYDHLAVSSLPSSASASVSVSPVPQTTDGVIVDSQKTGKLIPFKIKPKVAPFKLESIQVPLPQSISRRINNQWANDLGLFFSHRFKVGFGLRNTLIIPSTQKETPRAFKNEHLLDMSSSIFQERNQSDYSATILQRFQISALMHYDNFSSSIVGHLEIQLRHSLQEDVDGSECPWIKSESGSDLLAKHLNEAVKLINLGELEEYAVSVWSLCLALWGDHEDLEGREPNSHFVIMCRRNLLSDWLENELTYKDLLTKNVTKHNYLDHLFELVTCHKVTDACELAFKYDDANLSLLLSQLSSGPTIRQLMEDQLAIWHMEKADQFIDLERLKLFMLVSGVPLMSSAHGPINLLEGLDWIKVLAIHLWYICSPTASITDALFVYEASFKNDEFYSAPPSPFYVDQGMKSNKSDNLYDLRYHILQLFSKRSHSMESLLNPSTHTSDPMDYRLSWLILQTFEALGYRHCSELAENQLHVGFANQLESNGLWEWAIFVLLHVKERNQRELAVQNMLYRYVQVSKDALSEKEKFVVNNLGVPKKWIDYAKAVKAGSVRDHQLQAKYLLRAKQYALAHEVIFQFIAPDAIINDNLDYLHNLLSNFENTDLNGSVKVPNWSNQGQIFLDFIDINDKFKNLKALKNEGDIEARWENLKPQLADLCSRINLLPTPTPKHRLCQSEIAQNLACLVRGILLVCPVLNPCLIIKVALERLPLPQEFAQQELRTLLNTLVDDLSKAKLNSSQELVLQ